MPVSINERSGSAAVDMPMRPADGQEATSLQVAELDVWEYEGGRTSCRPPEVPRQHAGRQFDEFSG
jgi:hypothetical protein